MYTFTRKMCKDIVEDLRCMQLVWVFKPDQFDEETVLNHLDEISQDIMSLKKSPYRFATRKEYSSFISKVTKFVKGLIKIMDATERHEDARDDLEEEMFIDRYIEAHPKHRGAHMPWSHYLASGAPSLAVSHFLAPYVYPPPKDPRLPHIDKIVSSSVQALPQATTAILARWTWEFKRAIDFYHAVCFTFAN